MKLIRTAFLFACLLVSIPAFAAHSVTLNWVASTTPNVTYEVFQVQCSTAQDNKTSAKSGTCAGTTTTIGTGITATTFTDNSVQASMSYEYYVKAVNSSNVESPSSVTIVATVGPAAPTGVTATSH